MVKITELTALDFNYDLVDSLAPLRKEAFTDDDNWKKVGEIHRRRLKDGVITLVATIDEKVVGTASIIIETKFLFGKKVGHIEDVSVKEDMQHQGIGKLLMEKCIEIAKKEKCYKVILNSSFKNLPFYRNLGFARNAHIALEMRL